MKNVIITGENSGLGFETAKKIAVNHKYRVILACRNAEKAAAAKSSELSYNDENAKNYGIQVLNTLKAENNYIYYFIKR